MDSDGRRGGKDLRETGEGDNIIRIYCKRILFFKKKKITHNYHGQPHYIRDTIKSISFLTMFYLYFIPLLIRIIHF